MNGSDFLKQQQRAVEQMREMNSRSMPKPERPAPPKQTPKKPPSGGGLELPFMNLLKEQDSALILGLLLILFSENADKRLLFALVYILL